MDALVAPGIDHRRARACAFTDEVDAVVAERLACGLEIVDPLRQAVAPEIEAVRRQSVGARPERLAACAVGRLLEQVGRALHRRLHSGQSSGAVHASVADEDHVVLSANRLASGKVMLVMPGRPEAEDRLGRVG